jgi:NADH-quinone oxidoreductase subunit F
MTMQKIQLNKVCYRTLHLQKPWALQTYRSLGGYSVWNKILQGALTPEFMLTEIKKSTLEGRGGGGFPVWKKLTLVKDNHAKQKYIICNLSESDPYTFKDEGILHYNPHQLIEGMLIAGYIIGANIGYFYIKGKLIKHAMIMKNAINEVKQEKLIDDQFVLSKFCSLGGYVCGEETALIEHIEGNIAQPRYKPPYPTESGLYACPTLVSNAETLATLPVLLEKGADWYLRMGRYKIFSISGQIRHPGNYEVPLNIRFSELLELAGGVNNNKQIKAVFPGGISAPILPMHSIMHLHMDYKNLLNAGSSLGTGGIFLIEENACMVIELAQVLAFYSRSACKKCIPCREGIAQMCEIVNRIIHGKGVALDVEALHFEAEKMYGKTLCALGSSIALVIKSFLQYFFYEFQAYIGRHNCDTNLEDYGNA